jgi:plasmid maintenance system antidote protein VapI
MDLFMEKTRTFAQETTKTLQEMVKETRKLTQELALKLSKRLRGISSNCKVEASKKVN